MRIVDFVIKNYDFDKILIIPAFKPPHKDCDIKTAYHRLNMCRLAFEGFEKTEVSDIEFQREEKSYTYVTICELYKKYEIDGKINFIIGTDAFKHIKSWYEADKLKTMVKFILFDRGDNFSDLEYDYAGYDVEIQPLPFEDISSTVLRGKISSSEDVTDYIPESIRNYTEEHDLYKNRY